MKKYKIVCTTAEKGMKVIEDLTYQEMLQEVFLHLEELDATNLYVEKLHA